jgi:Family of unknown function (DUF5681)
MSDGDRVGFKRPPLESRFKAGVSGNPRGRPKRRPTFRSVLMEELAAPLPTQGSKPAVSKLQALVKTLVAAAIAGNARAQSLLVGAMTRLGESDDQEAASLTSEDGEILEAYVSGEIERRATDSDPVLPSRDED